MSAPRQKTAQTPDSDLRGQMAGEYRILRRLGAGGFGTVYEAEHPVLKRKAAVKVLHVRRTVDAAAVARFISEAQSANQIKNRHIVDIFSFGKLPTGQHFYVMDLLDGAALDQYLLEKTKLPPEVALPLLRPVAAALDALHEHGIIHRDVKPPNIFLAWESNNEVVPKLLDFGLVKLLSDSPIHTASGVPMGTPFYMSPEQCRGEKVDARADVYSFGVICHELMAGQPPFGGDTPAAVLVSHLVKTPPRLSEVCPELPAALDAPILHMLAKEPADRPHSVGAAFAELEEAARSAGINVEAGFPHLPRPTLPAPADESLSYTVAENSVSTASEQGQSRTRLRQAFIASGLLVLLAGGGLYSLLGNDRVNDSALASANDAVPSAPVPSVAPVVPNPTVARSADEPKPQAAELTLSGVPDGTRVLLGDELLGETPGKIPLRFGAEPLELTLSSRGYENKTVRVVPNGAVALNVTLVKSVVRSQQPHRVSKDLENPF
jgi:serine/threonine protein kinase